MNFGFRFFGTVASVAVPDFLFYGEAHRKKTKMKLTQEVKISYPASTADAEGGLKPGHSEPGLTGVWGAVCHQLAAEVYTEALLATICVPQTVLEKPY